MSNSKKKAVIASVILVVIFIIVIAGVIFSGLRSGRIRLGNLDLAKKDDYETSTYAVKGEKWNEGKIEYNGKYYKYNLATKIYLFMGVDKEGKVEKAPDYVSGGQSDAMFLLITDDKNKKNSVIPINRNTMTDIKLCDQEGKYYGTFTAQICLQHGYGDGLKGSCTKTVEAVSNLFYDIPIDGYIATNMDSMMILNNLAGGVEVTVLEDVEYPSLNVKLKAGETKVLSDPEAYAYLRKRDIEEFGTADKRLEREKQYLLNLQKALSVKVNGNQQIAIDMYNALSDYTVSNVIFNDIAEDLVNYGFTEDDLYEIPGVTQMGKSREEFIIDKDALYDIIIRTLYEDVS